MLHLLIKYYDYYVRPETELSHAIVMLHWVKTMRNWFNLDEPEASKNILVLELEGLIFVTIVANVAAKDQVTVKNVCLWNMTPWR
jgi:hypothetical protein